MGHGGVGGAVVETLLVAGIVAVFGGVWLRERRASRPHDRDQIKPQ